MQEPAVDVSDAPDSNERQALRDRITVLQYRGMERIAIRWPERLGRRLFDVYARVFHAGAPSIRSTVARNLAQVLGRPPDSDAVKAAVREAFLLYGRYWYETFRLRVMPPEEINKRFVVYRLANIDRALEAGRGGILALPHMGNWDAAGYFLCVNGYRLAAVAEQLRPKPIFEQFLRHREALGMRIVPLTADRQTGE